MTMNSDPEPHKSRRDAAGRFGAGNTIGAAGRPKGSRNRTTLVAEKLLDGQSEALSQKAIELALCGDTTALILCLERTLPARKDRLIEIDLPSIDSAEAGVKAVTLLIAQVADGQLSALEAADITTLIERRMKIAEVAEFELRLKNLEERLK